MFLFRSINLLFAVLYWGIILRALLSFFPNIKNQYYPFARVVYQITDPFMIPIENFTYKHIRLGNIDVSPIIAIFILDILKRIIFWAFYFRLW